jgi:hypothetical protein
MTVSIEKIFETLKQADADCAQIPHDALIYAEQISAALTDIGSRRTMRLGAGDRIRGPEEFDFERHDPRRRHAIISARMGRDMVVERERAHRQHIFFWRMFGPWMQYPAKGPLNETKQFCADAMMLAAAGAAAACGDYVGILSGGPVISGKSVAPLLFEQVNALVDENGVTPFHLRRMPRNSTAVLVIDALISTPQDLENGLQSLRHAGASGYVIGVQHKDELTFPFVNHRKFMGLGADLSVEFKKAERRRDAYLQKAEERLARVQDICTENQFQFILQSTDRPLHLGLMPLFGLEPPQPSATAIPTRQGGPK